MTLSLAAKTLKSVHTPYFTLHINQADEKIIIWMELHTNSLTTKQIPETYPILKQLLPNILKHRCFNNLKQPFFQEVVQTEVELF